MFLGGLFFEWIQTVLILAGYVSGNATFPKPLNKSEEKKYLDLYAKGDESAKNVLIEHVVFDGVEHEKHFPHMMAV